LFQKERIGVKAVRRIGRELIEHALECLKQCGAEAIHCARKDVKKARAVLRLVRSEIGKKTFCRITELLREAAHQLAAPRDAYVKVQTLRNLTRHFKGQLAAGALRYVRAEFRKARDEEVQEFAKKKTVRSVERTLRRVAKELDCLKVRGKG
jgi:hypothetical protein